MIIDASYAVAKGMNYVVVFKNPNLFNKDSYDSSTFIMFGSYLSFTNLYLFELALLIFSNKRSLH